MNDTTEPATIHAASVARARDSEKPPATCGGAHMSEREGSQPATFNPIRIDEQKCVRCDLCDWICPGDLIYHEEGNKTKLPVVAYPDECWYCGLCQSICPTNAIEVIFPQQMIRNQTDVMSLLGKIEE